MASILLPTFVGELSFALWLAVKGLNAAKWRALSVRADYDQVPMSTGLTSP
jgi:hypothetical protein